MLDHRITYHVTAPQPLPLQRLFAGKSCHDAVTVLPRLFNLCRGAQDIAARLATGTDIPPTLIKTAADEALRDHVLRLYVALPQRLGVSVDMPTHWTGKPDVILSHAIGAIPTTLTDFQDWMRSGHGIAPVFAAIDAAFPNRTCDTGLLHPATDDMLFSRAPMENSVAGRHADHPLMQAIADHYGHGPLWRTAARLLDLHHEPDYRDTPFGAIVTAPRGIYGLRISCENDQITDIERITPTDHLTTPDGILERSLHSLPDPSKLSLLMDILDPCTPITVKEADHA